MTYPNATPKHNDDDNVDEASSLLTIATAAPASSFSLRQEGMPAKKKKNNVTMRTMIVTTFFFLGTLAVIYGSRGSSSSNTHHIDGTSEALLLGQNQAALEVYDPNQDYCFMAPYGFGIYCWYPTEDHNDSIGNWKAVTDRPSDSCGPRCPAPPPTPPPTHPKGPVYDRKQDFCFKDKVNAGKYCWYYSDRHFPSPVGQWEGDGGRGDGDCGDLCTKFVHGGVDTVYDPKQDFCYADTDNANKYCWYPSDRQPCGNWKGEGGHVYGDCGDICTNFEKRHPGDVEVACGNSNQWNN